MLECIRAETSPRVAHDSPNVKYLTEECPRLQALVNEVLRLHMGSALMRHVVAPTVIGGKTLRAGKKIIVELAPFPLLPFLEVSSTDPLKLIAGPIPAAPFQRRRMGSDDA